MIRVERRIKLDPRHTEYTQLSIGDAGLRLFPQWNMGLVNMELVGLDFDVSEIRDTLIDPATGRKAPVQERGTLILESLRAFQKDHLEKVDAEAA